MICPDCGKEIGRFQAASDPTGKTEAGDRIAEFNSIKCPRTGRAILPEHGPEPRELGSSKERKAWKRKKNAQKTRELAEV